MEEVKSKFDLTSFKKASEQMIATNAAAYRSDIRGRVARLRDYSAEDIERIVNSGSLVEQQKLSRNYFWKDGFYRRIVVHYATLLLYSGILIPNPVLGKTLSKDAISKRYHAALDFVEKMSLPSLLTNFSIAALVDGCYYGVIQTLDKNNIAILDLPTGYCCSRFKDMKGNDIIEFDVSYFYTIIDKDKRREALALYPKVVSDAFRKYERGKTANRWVFIPSEIGICFPMFDSRPFFLNVIPATIDFEEAVDVEKERDLEEIRKIIVQKIPHLTDGGLLFEPDEAEEIHKGTVGMMKGNKNISVLTTYADVDSIVSKTSAEAASSNNLEKNIANIYFEAGVSGELFAAKGSSTVPFSNKNDLALMMYLGNKYSVFITNILNRLYSNTSMDFTYQILPVSYQNQKEYIEDNFKLAGMGYSFLLPALASGLSQRSYVNLKDLENDILSLEEKLIPLSSAYNQSAEAGTPGAPTKKEEEKAEKTIKNEETINKTGQGGSDK